MKILLTLMSMEIGGAETHVLSLAKELNRRGHTPVVVSSGGIYEEELSRSGINHYKLPLASKKPWDLLSSTFKIMDIINKEKIDIIHAHGRIPSLVSRVASLFKGIHFITTVHAVYKVNSYRFFSCFGEKTICISEDTKDHVVKNYKVKKENIVIIPNGIDLGKFNPSVNTTGLEFYNGDKSQINISYISRMEGELASRAVRVSKILSEYAEKKNLKIQYLIVGDGKDFNYVVSSINQEMKKGQSIDVKILGKRTDIPEIINYSDFVVCVSRSALEAMACETPVILLGGEGYEGLLTPDNFSEAQKTNFTGRASDKVFTDDKFLRDIDYLIGDGDKKKIESLGKYLKSKLVENYAVEKVVEKTIGVYKEVLGGNKR